MAQAEALESAPRRRDADLDAELICGGGDEVLALPAGSLGR